MSEHTRTRQQREEQTTESTESESTACPECSGSLVIDDEHGETVCEDCGLVVESDEIDRGPEWRAFDSSEKDEKSRVGAPTTNMMHDKGLSTNIDWRDKDAYGNSLSGKQRQKMQRLRKWNERFRTRDSKERNLKQALGEIDRMASALGLPENVRETASVIYRRALDEDLLPGRSIEGVSTASVYAAARQAGVPRSLDEITEVSRVEKSEIARTYRYVVRELSLEVRPADPESYVPRFASSLELSDEAEHRARQLLQNAKEQGVHSGKSPVGLAAAAVYAAALLTNEKTTQAAVSEVADISEVTIRNRYHELLEAEQDLPVA
ncbi:MULTISPECIES: transcription initiation factor IIB [Haloarcula]|jgi:transcription initiation factor TFIIB|uniref:Transcription initiation factor IIB n=9 Tax=Haloarcula TaxID=2237 RepID=Q5V147_HALMA|nr:MULTISPECIES: transcription initiation factor IIB [Haloarcula]AAV46756.1 transcription initiation factor IIB [Haloarcula marismortui ATCC 43049]AUG48141.1 transcription initiation factor IIB 2 [Haloarcula taiwanensis]EMA15429.1 transcription initiation factor IIB [Haloarcula sinaiiensis ATCC 33800]EMA19272.1 transcription initiation factor IIB [Haloarcula argentinensis DSM 12282]EMA20515.1 transcription initiation factor IIB [Haloarcula californiae ATCC 33799]